MKPTMFRIRAFRYALMGLSTTAYAHHGPGTFDLTKTVTYHGRLTSVELINPHSWLHFAVTAPDGSVADHRCEMRSVHTLRRSGWTNDLFPVGEEVTITASPDRADANSCYLQTIVFASGNHMDRYGQYVKAEDGAVREVRGQIVIPTAVRQLRLPTGEPNISGDWAPEQRVMTDPRGVGGGFASLSELSKFEPGQGNRPARTNPGTGPQLYGGTELTEFGKRSVSNFTPEANPRLRCETTSIIFDWAYDGAINRITQNEDTIVLEYGQMNLKRTIYLKMEQHPANVPRTRAGHSIGRWEGDVLVVDTVGFVPGVLNAPVSHSEQLHVVERFSLDPATMQLTRSYIAEDPAHFVGRYTGSDVVLVADAPYTSDNCTVGAD